MDQHSQGFRTFEDLEAYQLARQFRKCMYAVTRRLPKFEMFELGSQVRRAATSLTNGRYLRNKKEGDRLQEEASAYVTDHDPGFESQPF